MLRKAIVKVKVQVRGTVQEKIDFEHENDCKNLVQTKNAEILLNKISYQTRWHYNNCLWELKYQLNKKQIVEKWKKKIVC